MGKPYVPVLRAALGALAERGVEPDAVAVVGDSLAHDVRGALSVGVDSIWVQGGVDSSALCVPPGPSTVPPLAALADNLCRHHGVRPTHTVGVFFW